MAVPWDRFRVAEAAAADDHAPSAAAGTATVTLPVVPSATRKVSAHGMISFASTRYKAGRRDRRHRL
jgi:hypothetical protein